MYLPEIVHSSQFIVHRFRKRAINHQPLTINRNSTGFTLIELLVVISIIAILMAVATVSYTNAQMKGRDNKRKSDLKAVQQALEIYFQQNGKYPSTETTGQAGRIKCNVTGDITAKSWGTVFVCDATGTPDPPAVTYMSPLPKDPAFSGSTTQDYYYDSSSPNNSYVISATLENTKDQDNKNVPTSNPPFGASYAWNGNRNYCVINP